VSVKICKKVFLKIISSKICCHLFKVWLLLLFAACYASSFKNRDEERKWTTPPGNILDYIEQKRWIMWWQQISQILFKN